MNGFFTPWKRKFGVVTLFCDLIIFSGCMRCQTPGFGPVSGNAEIVGLSFLWVFVIPLTAITAYLLLSKPRQMPAKGAE